MEKEVQGKDTALVKELELLPCVGRSMEQCLSSIKNKRFWGFITIYQRMQRKWSQTFPGCSQLSDKREQTQVRTCKTLIRCQCRSFHYEGEEIMEQDVQRCCGISVTEGVQNSTDRTHTWTSWPDQTFLLKGLTKWPGGGPFSFIFFCDSKKSISALRGCLTHCWCELRKWHYTSNPKLYIFCPCKWLHPSF